MSIEFEKWIGKQESCREIISSSHVKKIALSLNAPIPQEGEALPFLWQWAFFINPLPLNELGTDGHPKRGGFLPPADNRNRMWAGGRLSFIKPLIIGQEGMRVSTIQAIKEKEGSTGKLLFVTVLHEYSQHGELCIREEQDIVYREPSPPKLIGTEIAPSSKWSEDIEPSSTMLFRYSAVTFNGHRIHYDYPYSTQQEGYPGLVVHGPMIATYVLDAFVKANRDKKVKSFKFKGLRPLICPKPFKVEGTFNDDGKTAQCWAQQDGTLAQLAEVSFE
ncbi:itaconyl-CoA hydratase [Pelistega indica]|uniref:Itaconyl-CoA hydratase n=2 Tax=Alcaligenaceae TaxID=506 RepID=V8G1Z5_9BURK|nr:MULTISPECIES: MaoC family dehydratase N-terminal domain-containing protein [Pelistega]ETD69722.1 itaconyl-CoA hydratase [Pelistega indica]